MPISTILDPFELEFMQRAAFEVALLAPLAGILGTQIVLRGLAFYTHGVGTAAFPGLVVAGPLGIPPALAALAVGIAFGAALEGLGRVARLAYDAATALLLVAALAIGIVLASDVYESGAEVDQLLFGSLLAIGNDELRATAIALGVVLVAAVMWRRRWVAIGFDSESARSLGIGVGSAERALLAAIAIAVVVTLDATGALLVASILITPAATARLLGGRIARIELTAGGIALAEGLFGLWLAYELDVPPGATIAVLGGTVFAICAAARLALRAGERRLAATGGRA